MLGLAFIPSLVVSAVIGVEGVFRSFTFNVNVDMVGFKSTICYLFSIFPIGGKTGTIKNRYKDSAQPYIYAKTGTLSNNVTLSGYLKTKSGRTLIFSLMNNNSIKELSWIRNENEKLLRLVRDNY